MKRLEAAGGKKMITIQDVNSIARQAAVLDRKIAKAQTVNATAQIIMFGEVCTCERAVAAAYRTDDLPRIKAALESLVSAYSRVLLANATATPTPAGRVE